MNDQTPIVVVYHVFLVKKWKELVTHQLNLLIKTGLYQAADVICVTVNLGDVSKQEAKSFFDLYDKLCVDFYSENAFELPGIAKVHEMSKKIPNSAILYFHTKGVYNDIVVYNRSADSYQYVYINNVPKLVKKPSVQVTDEFKNNSEFKRRNTTSWRECMEYFLIWKWRDCLALLKEYETVGTSQNEAGWMVGNFWWAAADFLNKKPNVSLSSRNRWDAEDWLYSGILSKNRKSFEWFHFDYNAYITNFNENFYLHKWKCKNQNIILEKATYSFAICQQDEGPGWNSPVCLFNDRDDITELVKINLNHNNQKAINFDLSTTPKKTLIDGQLKIMLFRFFPEQYPTLLFEIGVLGHRFAFTF